MNESLSPVSSYIMAIDYDVKALKSGAYPFIFAKIAENCLKKRSIPVHTFIPETVRHPENGACPFTFLFLLPILYVENSNMQY